MSETLTEAEVKPGLFKNVPMSEYRQWGGVSPSKAKHALISPLAYISAVSPEVTDEMMLGTACHTCVFEPDLLPLQIVVWDGERRAGKDWKDFEAVHSNKIILTKKLYARALKVRDRAQSHPAIRAIMKQKHDVEVSLRWKYKATSAPIVLDCKGRADMIADRIYDLKTIYALPAEKRNFDAIYNLAVSRGHFHQQGGYQQGYKAVTGEHKGSSLIYVETRPPFDAIVKDIEEGDGEDLARYQWIQSLEAIARGTHSGKWPGRSETRTPFIVPEGALNSDALDLDFTE